MHLHPFSSLRNRLFRVWGKKIWQDDVTPTVAEAVKAFGCPP
jgi:hypothetical protein